MPQHTCVTNTSRYNSCHLYPLPHLALNSWVLSVGTDLMIFILWCFLNSGQVSSLCCNGLAPYKKLKITRVWLVNHSKALRWMLWSLLSVWAIAESMQTLQVLYYKISSMQCSGRGLLDLPITWPARRGISIFKWTRAGIRNAAVQEGGCRPKTNS